MCVAEQKRELLIPTSGGARLRGQTVPLLGVTAHLGPRSRAELSRWAAAALAMAGELEGCKPLSGLLSGLAQNAFHGNSSITEELLHSQLYPEVPPEEFRPFLAKMRGILKVLRLDRAALPPPRSPGPAPRPGRCPVQLLQSRGARSATLFALGTDT
ncbi:hypothetical protein ACRRTK_014450 [Alexandromys fortis]